MKNLVGRRGEGDTTELCPLWELDSSFEAEVLLLGVGHFAKLLATL